MTPLIPFLTNYLLRRPRFTPRKHAALLLALPYAEAAAANEFFDPAAQTPPAASGSALRNQLLHQLGLRVDASDADVSAHLQRHFEQQWFRLDLQAPLPGDDPRAALAFACARTTLLARAAMLMQWITPECAWRVLLLNAQRAQDCFDSWDDYGHAFLTGRRQWLAGLRADLSGPSLDATTLRRWRAPGGAWFRIPWPGLPAFDPRHN
ncbi:MAG: DUF1266 domain-containing protein [Pseudomonadales bacterium]|jgi:hypothetical protein|nr:DUF1266 domain-containing protein [Pseudomonadales bacterium]